MSILIMILSAAAIILIAKFGLVTGIEQVAASLQWTAKARGQCTGFATSAPEFVCLVAAGLAGVWEAGLWNIASSNIINFILMSLAVGWNRQERELFNWRFLDEIVFASLPIVVPLVLMWYSFDERWTVIPVLLLFFGLYRIVDSRVNRTESHSAGEQAAGSLGIGLSLTATALVALAIAGFFLGGATENVVNRIGINPAIAGWILGFTSSLPEVITFFSVYGRARAAGKLESLADTQEVLDNLTASNMANVGVVYPVGLLVYLIVAAG